MIVIIAEWLISAVLERVTTNCFRPYKPIGNCFQEPEFAKDFVSQVTLYRDLFLPTICFAFGE